MRAFLNDDADLPSPSYFNNMCPGIDEEGYKTIIDLVACESNSGLKLGELIEVRCSNILAIIS